MRMNKILKIGFVINFLALVTMIILMILNKQELGLSMYIFLIGAIILCVGTVFDKTINKVSKVGLIISCLVYVVMSILVILGRGIPDFTKYFWGGGLFLAFIGAAFKNKKKSI